jgi:hypothetical protein
MTSEEIITRIEERCGCGAMCSVITAAEIERANSSMEQWRSRHREICPYQPVITVPDAYNPTLRTTTGDWQDKYLGSPCGVCRRRLDHAREITTCMSRPIHTTCRSCFMCAGKKGVLVWKIMSDEGPFYGPERPRDRLVHPACFKLAEEAERARAKRAAQEASGLSQGLDPARLETGRSPELHQPNLFTGDQQWRAVHPDPWDNTHLVFHMRESIDSLEGQHGGGSGAGENEGTGEETTSVESQEEADAKPTDETPSETS